MNKTIILILVIALNLFFFNAFAKDDFIFETSEILVTENNNIIKSNNRSKISLSDNIIISADTFKFNKSLNILNLNGNVIFNDKKKNLKINSQNIEYKKNIEEIISNGETEISIDSVYEFQSKDVVFNKNKNTLNSSKKSTILDKYSNKYTTDNFIYFIDNEFLKASNVNLELFAETEEFRDNYYFENVFFDLKNQNFKAKNSKFSFRKNLFNRIENDPRIYAKSITKKDDIITLDKAVFTSCKKSEKCPSWNLKAKKIIHDKKKKQLIYDSTILQIYDVPVFYFPKFYHPDPTVERQSGFLIPKLNQSKSQGSSFQLPYFGVISENKDYTFKPIIFNQKKFLIQNEYRQKNKNSFFITDFAYGKGYESSYLNNNNKDINHLFAKFDYNLNLPNFMESKLSGKLERVSNDSYLKIFKSNLTGTEILPVDDNNLKNELKLELNNLDYNFNSGINIFENLQQTNNDRYQYIFPYYEFNKLNVKEYNFGNFDFSSSGSNNLSETNKLLSKVINDLNFKSFDYFLNNGTINNFNISVKNSNFVGKNDSIYQSNPRVKVMSIIEANTSLPLIKKTENYENSLTPKISLRFNPGKISNFSEEKKLVNFDNIFEINRLGLSDEFEPGKSLTVGLDFKKQKVNEINNYFEFKIASVLRDKNQINIPKSTSINNKTSNLIGSINFNKDELLKVNYDYSIKNDFSLIEYSSLNLKFTKDSFYTEMNMLQEKGSIGTENALENIVGYNIDENNLVKFKTRRNRKFNLTEFYDLIYQFKNDCLTAGIQYKKTFYNDKDIKPNEDLMFTLTLFPLATIAQSSSK